MKILGTLTVDTPNALDKVTDLNADLLDGKSSEQYLSRGLGDFNYAANYERSSVDNNTEDTSITLGRDTILTSTTTKVANSSLILKTGGLTNDAVSSNPSSLTLYKNGDSPSGNTIILGSAGIVNTSGALILNNNSSGDFLIKQGATNEVRLRIAEKVTYLGNFTNTSIVGSTATYVDKFDTALVVGTPTTAATSPAVFIGRFNRTVGANTNSEASVAGIDFKGNILTGLSIIGKSIVFRTDDSGVVSDTTISDRMVISSTGLIGIGLANPTTMLQIKPNNNNTGLIKCTNAADTKTLFDVDSVGRVGINATPFENTQLALTGTSSTTTIGRFGIYNDLTHNIAEATHSVYGLYTRVTADSTNGSTLATVYGLYVAAIAGNVVVGNKYGIYQVGTADSNVFNGATTFSNAFTLSAITNTINIGGAQTIGVLTLGGTSQTGTITLGRSTVTHTLNIDAGATTSDNTKTINIGTGGVSGSTTTITYGSSIGTTHTFNGSVDISGSLTVRNPAVYASSTSGVTQIVLGDSGSKTVVLEREKASYNTATTKIYSENGYNAPSLGASFYTEYVKLYTLGIERMRINAAGNILIGKTTDDGNKLQVEGGVSVTQLSIYKTGAYDATTHNYLDIFGSYQGTNPTTTSNAGASTGIRMGSIEHGKHAIIEAVSEDFFGYSRLTGLSFKTSNLDADPVEAVRINAGGNVGIGAIPPTEKLHVDGNVLVTGTVSGSNISNSYFWAFTVTGGATSITTNVISVDSYGTGFSGVIFRLRKGDEVAASNLAPNSVDLTYKNVFVYRSTTTGGTTFEQVFPDIEISSIGHCTLTFATAQTNYIFRIVFA